MATPSLLETLHNQLRMVADPGKARGMQAYMKSAIFYLGVSAVPLGKVCGKVFRQATYTSAKSWQRDVLAIWRGANFREERYAAIQLTGIGAARPFQTLDALPMYEEIVVTGAWWDYVDAIATQRLILLLAEDPTAMKRKMITWSKCGNLRKRRSSIL